MTTSRPLVVDLDGTLINTDLLVETASAYLIRKPGGVVDLARWKRAGKPALKRELALRSDLDVTVLPYRDDVVTWLRDERASGRCVVLATASDEQLARRIADHLRLFDEVIATSGEVNLKGETKRAALVERFGEGGFDYVGDDARAEADLAVWRSAATAHLVLNDGARTLDRVRPLAPVGAVFPRRGGTVRDLIAMLRPYQWVKNALLFIPLLTAQRLDDPSAILATLIAVACFCVAASSVYVLNDLVDLAHDRHHPRKRRRPLAAGRVNLLVGWASWPVLLVLGVGVAALTLPGLFVASLIAYLIATVAYTFWLKRQAVVDVVTLGLLYTARIVAGAAAIDVALSMWLLTFSMFFFLSLALIKRVSELARIRRTTLAEGAEAGQARGRGYVANDLELLSSYGVSSSVAAVVIFSLYVADPKTSVLYQTPDILWCSVPVLLGWLMRVWLLAHRGTMHEDPIVFAIRDRASRFAGVLVVAIFVLAKVVTL